MQWYPISLLYKPLNYNSLHHYVVLSHYLSIKYLILAQFTCMFFISYLAVEEDEAEELALAEPFI